MFSKVSQQKQDLNIFDVKSGCYSGVTILLSVEIISCDKNHKS
ncbi:MAG: hypothetical protein AB8V06_07865 [Francisella endosymbiont of Hyalomma asiaticum]